MLHQKIGLDNQFMEKLELFVDSKKSQTNSK